MNRFENLDSDTANEILIFFTKLKVVIEDEDYLDYYLKNLSETKGYSYNQLYTKLSKKVENRGILQRKLKNFFSETEDKQIEKFIERNYRKLMRMESDFKRINYLVQKGFKPEIVKKSLKNITYNT